MLNDKIFSRTHQTAAWKGLDGKVGYDDLEQGLNNLGYPFMKGIAKIFRRGIDMDGAPL